MLFLLDRFHVFLDCFLYPRRPSHTQGSPGYHLVSSILGRLHIPQRGAASSWGWALKPHTRWKPGTIKTHLENLLGRCHGGAPPFSPKELNTIIFLPLLGGAVVCLSEQQMNCLLGGPCCMRNTCHETLDTRVVPQNALTQRNEGMEANPGSSKFELLVSSSLGTQTHQRNACRVSY